MSRGNSPNFSANRKIRKQFNYGRERGFPPLSVQCFTENIEIKKQDEIFIEPVTAADNGFPFFLE